METIWLEDFLALAASLNFSRAAERRCVTQPAFSRRIRALEEWVGAPLFLRTTHAVSLTPAGEHFMEHAAMLSRAVLQLRRDTREVARRDASHITIAATHVLSFTFFPKWIRANESFIRRGTLNLVSDNMQACEEIMRRGDAQFLLCHDHSGLKSRFEAGQFKSAVVGRDMLVPVSAPNAAGSGIWRLGSTTPVDYLAYSERSGLGRIIEATSVMSHLPGGATTVVTSHLAATLMSMVRSGQGLAWIPLTLASDDLESGSVVLAGPDDAFVPIDIVLMRPTARQSPSVEAAWAELT